MHPTTMQATATRRPSSARRTTRTSAEPADLEHQLVHERVHAALALGLAPSTASLISASLGMASGPPTCETGQMPP